MKYLFNDYMKYLKESTTKNEFSPDVYNFLSELPYGKFETELGEKIFKIDIDEIKTVGKFIINVYPQENNSIYVTFSLNSADKEQGLVTLFEKYVSTENKDFEKVMKKFISNVEKIVANLKSL